MHALIRLRPHRNRAFPSSQTLASDHKFTAPSSCSSPGPLFPSGSLHASSASWPPFFRPFSPTSPLCPRAFHPFLNHGSHGCPKFSPSRCVTSVGASPEPLRQGCRKQAQERHACSPAQFILTHPLTGHCLGSRGHRCRSQAHTRRCRCGARSRVFVCVQCHVRV